MRLASQSEITALYAARPQNFAFFLGAGASRSAGLATATDIIWDLKRRHYCREENQDISRQDIQSDAVKERIQTYMDAHGFPELWADQEYTTYFEKIFGDDKERQRQYMSAMLSEDKVALSVGNRVLGALLASGMCRIVFTTNFDSVVEKSVAEVGSRSLTAFHIEGSHAANNALNNEEFPIYCKLHGDFRYDSIKNLCVDLERQNRELSACLVNAANRFGFVVAGYSGRDESVMALFRQALETSNPFPHGLYWTGLKGGAVHPAVTDLLAAAQKKGVTAEFVEIETFDALMLRLWRNIETKSPDMDAKVRKAHLSEVNIPLPSSGQQQPLLRLNALPILDMPSECLSLSFKQPVEWDEVRRVASASEQTLILSKSDTVWCWGKEDDARRGFSGSVETVEPRALPGDIRTPGNLHLKGFIEEALGYALARERPLLVRARHGSVFLIVDQHADDVGGLDPLFQLVGKTSGKVPGVFTVPTPEKPKSEQVDWAEALRISVDQKGGSLWLMIDPDIWIWPPRARANARDFLDRRRSDRRNDKFNALLDAWVQLLFDTDERNSEILVKPFSEGNHVENPCFRIGNRTAFSRRLVS
ncbi:hypothetical protein JCM17846_28820 [Iodidimonas nitroreducens]|uniref:Uncharacterized protein n=1 Tax=Iodidimonas nitroreducens TaxID=1236968 RepID=A0A5A7NCK0_9PROT|nr:SIR2 family protein [Iodidimonas nitroreducens]GER05200.1 hypothetical protein JCM17846_28820 [Iodidimonas nitroreducens]